MDEVEERENATRGVAPKSRRRLLLRYPLFAFLRRENSPAVSALSRRGLLNLKKAVHLVPLETRETRAASEEEERRMMRDAGDDDVEGIEQLLAARRGQHEPAATEAERRAATADMV